MCLVTFTICCLQGGIFHFLDAVCIWIIYALKVLCVRISLEVLGQSDTLQILYKYCELDMLFSHIIFSQLKDKYAYFNASDDCFQTGFPNTPTPLPLVEQTESPALNSRHWLSCCCVSLAAQTKRNVYNFHEKRPTNGLLVLQS